MSVDNSTLAPEIQTDKDKSKTVPCTVCNRPLVVNQFYSPAKARCAEHKSYKPVSSAIRQAIMSTGGEGAPPVAPNHSLQDLRCPFDKNPMVLIRVDEMGWLTYKCQHCLSAVEIKPSWAPAILTSIPTDMKPVVSHFNTKQMEKGRKYAEEGEIERRQGIGNFVV